MSDCVDKKVLVVDDDIGILEAFKFMLRDRWSLRAVDNGKDALEALETERFCLVFLDIKMPDMSGFDVLRHIRTRLPNLNVIIITATEEEANPEIAKSLGVKHYLKKPLDFHQISTIADSF